MKTDIILAGVGGQGILSIAKIIGDTAVNSGLNLKQAEVHGMSQRGGDVQSHLRISDKNIYSDLIAHSGADLILSVEPMEALRYLPYLSEKGWVVTNTTPFENIPNYPSMDLINAKFKEMGNVVALDADTIAKDLGNPRGMNMVVTGAGSLFIDIEFSKIEESIETIFKRKGDKVVELNLECLRAGRKVAESYKK